MLLISSLLVFSISPGLKSYKLKTKKKKGLVVAEKLDKEDVNLKNDKQLSNSSFHIYNDIYKCIDDSEINRFYIHGNKSKEYIFVSVSNSNITLYDKYEIHSSNYIGWNSPEYGNYFIISRGTGCFQVHYLENDYFNLDKDNKLFTKSFNILNSKAANFKINSSLPEKEYKITIYIYCSENNFVKDLQIQKKNQKLEIDKEKDQYYYKMDYSIKSDEIVHLDVTFNLNNKNYITIIFKIKLNYIPPIVWCFVTLGSVAMILIIFFTIKYLHKYCQKKKKEREELDAKLIKNFEAQEEYKKKRKREKERIIKEKIRMNKRAKIQKTLNQVVKRASSLYDCIQKDYSLINEVCLLCAKCDKLPSLIESSEENEDYEGNEDDEEDDDDFENDNIIFKNYENNKNKYKAIDVIDDINEGNYKSFMSYISPKYCDHFYHKSCRDKFDQAYDYFEARGLIEYCNFCKIFLTMENMQKFGCFFSKEFFINYFRDTINNKFSFKSAREEIIKKIENIFYSKIEKSLIIDKDKKWRIDYIKQMNKNYLERFKGFRSFDKSINYFRFYELSINEDLIKEKKKLDTELEELDEKIKARDIERIERYEREEKRIREREENRKRERREREEMEENRKKEKREEKEGRKPVDLYRCSFCLDKCVTCGGKISGSGRTYGYYKTTYYYRAHSSCIPNNMKKKCIICLKNPGTIRCNDECYHCFDKRNKNEEKCYYCKKRLKY